MNDSFDVEAYLKRAVPAAPGVEFDCRIRDTFASRASVERVEISRHRTPPTGWVWAAFAAAALLAMILWVVLRPTVPSPTIGTGPASSHDREEKKRWAAPEPSPRDLEEKNPRPAPAAIVEEPGGTITGIVKFKGPQPLRKPLDTILGNAYCSEACKAKAPIDEKWVFGKNGDDDTLANVLVYVAKGVQGKFAPPKAPKVLDQVGCVYTPRVVGVMVGQTLQIRNSDATLHNVMGNLKTNRAFNEGMSVKGDVLEKVFLNPEFKADFRCFMHPWMVAYVHVMEHPFYAVTGLDGTFTLKGLPPGEYEIAALHESSRFAVSPVRVTVSVRAGERKAIEFVYRDPR